MDSGRVWTAAERRAVLAEHVASGLSVYEFARRKRIPASTVYGWRSASRRAGDGDAARSRAKPKPKPKAKPKAKSPASPKPKAPAAPQPRVLPVSVVGPTPEAASTEPTVVLELASGRRLLLRAGFRPEEVASLVRALEPTSC